MVLRFVFRIKREVSFTDIRNNIGIESLFKLKKSLRKYFYIKAYEREIHIPDLKLIKKSIIHIGSLDYLHLLYQLSLTLIHSGQEPHEICVVLYANYFFCPSSEFSRSSSVRRVYWDDTECRYTILKHTFIV